MKRRRWFSGPQLQQWKMMVAAGDYYGHFWHWPRLTTEPWYFDGNAMIIPLAVVVKFDLGDACWSEGKSE